MNKYLYCLFTSVLLAACSDTETASPADTCSPQYAPYACRVVAFKAGDGAGFGQDQMPDIALGPPNPNGESISTDVLSLGMGGEITIELAAPATDGEGPDFTIFENPFVINGSTTVFKEPALVSVSEDGEIFYEFPCDPAAPDTSSCAGVHPVLANTMPGISADNPMVSGGDLFDLSAIGQSRARYIRIVDLKTVFGADGKAGFDFDAAVALHPE